MHPRIYIGDKNESITKKKKMEEQNELSCHAVFLKDNIIILKLQMKERGKNLECFFLIFAL